MRHPEAFFDRLEAGARELRTIVGELYFELHRGTYTTQAALKRGNRRCEAALHDAELAAAVAARLGRAPYPAAELAEAWRVLLVTQFHDILPGTSITEVNERARADLAGVEATADRLTAAALAALGDGGGGAQSVPVNTIPWPRREVARDPDGTLVLAEAPPCGPGRVVAPGPDDGVRIVRTPEGGAVLENAHLTATLTPGGAIASLVHRATGREALAAPANRLELYEDRPVAWDAWDVDPFHLETRADCAPADGIAAVREDALRVEVDFERPVGARSHLRQTVRLDAGARRLEVHTVADWHEDHRFLKAAFPLAVHADEATYETAFGVARRPTHYSTRHDLARFEVCGHRFADLGEHGFGVALLSDCKVRLERVRRHPAPQPAARAEDARRAGRHGRAPLRLRPRPARRRLAGRRDRGGGARVRRAAALGAGRRRAGPVGVGRGRARRRARHGQARRGRRRARPAPLRGPRRPRPGPDPPRPAVHRRAALEPARGRPRPGRRSTATRSSSTSGRGRSSRCWWTEAGRWVVASRSGAGAARAPADGAAKGEWGPASVWPSEAAADREEHLPRYREEMFLSAATAGRSGRRRPGATTVARPPQRRVLIRIVRPTFGTVAPLPVPRNTRNRPPRRMRTVLP